MSDQAPTKPAPGGIYKTMLLNGGMMLAKQHVLCCVGVPIAANCWAAVRQWRLKRRPRNCA